MLKLIKLEVKKFKLLGEIKGVSISYLCLVAFVLLGSFSDGPGEAKTILFEFQGLMMISEVTFLIYSSVILSKLVIGEYKNKTIMNMFMYPINRKRLITAKLIIVWVFTFATIILANLIIGGILVIINNNFWKLWTDKFTADVILNIVSRDIAIIVNSSFISFIPLLFGMMKKSTAAAIVSSVIIAMLVCSSGAEIMTTYNFMVLKSLLFGLMGILIAWITNMKVEKEDVKS